MVTIYVLEMGLDYAGHSAIGTYASIEDARAAADSYRDYSKSSFDELRVTEFELGATYAKRPARWARRRGSENWERVDSW